MVSFIHASQLPEHFWYCHPDQYPPDTPTVPLFSCLPHRGVVPNKYGTIPEWICHSTKTQELSENIPWPILCHSGYWQQCPNRKEPLRWRHHVSLKLSRKALWLLPDYR